ncbi:MAG: hypothetical protein ACREPQ_15690 [Rhodanobacter sp.]
MRGFWDESRWQLDGKTLLLPNGRHISLKQILQWQVDQIQGNHDLGGPWNGWRIRQQWLIAPGGTLRRGRIAEHVAKHIVQVDEWNVRETSRRQLTLF